MKIAILSMQRVVNFGSVLQAYSLRRILREELNAQVDFLDIEQEPSVPSAQSLSPKVDYAAPAAYPPGLLQKAKRWVIARLSCVNKGLIRRFMKKELGLTDQANSKHFDWVVVGSDEVFNHNKGVCLQLHGDVKQARRVISYAASCGSAVAEDIADTQRVRAAMGNFSAMSVRDAATQSYVSRLYDADIERHLDPVLVGDLYRRPHRKVALKRYLLVYAYGQRIRTAEEINAIREFAKARGLKTVAMGGSQFWCDLYVPTTPLRLMDYFYYADYVVTDTFHGTIFSVINRKNFAVLVRQTNQNKITSLLADLGLEERLAAQPAELAQILPRQIDYVAVESVLARERIRTREYLKKHLEV